MNKIKLSDHDLINYYGRNLISDNYVNFYNTGSGFEVKFHGTALRASFSDGFGQKLRIYIDGEDKGIIFVSDKLTICENLYLGIHSVRVIKVNYELRGTLILTNIETSGYFLKPEEKPHIKFEFFGDSITAGYGVNSDGSEDTISNEDGTLTYAYQTMLHFHAQAHFMAYSGVSIGLPYLIDWIVPDRFERYSFTTEESRWDFAKYIPDFVVINLGTNDAGLIETGKGDPSIFTKEYLRFLSDLRAYYKDAKIICSYGMMVSNEVISNAISEAVKKANDANIYFLKFKQVDCTGYNGHPSQIGQTEGAHQLIEFIENILK